MKLIWNNILPFKGYLAMAVYPFIFIRKEWKGKISSYTLNHEEIHFHQQKELLLIFFYLWYGIEYLVRLFQFKFDHSQAYYNISFEREAYENQHNLSYLDERKHFNFVRFLKDEYMDE